MIYENKQGNHFVVPRVLIHYLKLTPCDRRDFANGDRDRLIEVTA